MESVLPPKYLSSFEHEDWVSDVDMSVPGYVDTTLTTVLPDFHAHSSFLTASYDSNIRIFGNTGKDVQTLSAHTLPVLSACWLPSPLAEASTSGSRYVASGGMDRVVRVWDVPLSERESAEAVNTHALSLHTAPVSSVRSRVSSGKQRQLLSAGWDGLVGFWEFDTSDRSPGDDADGQDEADAPRFKKRRKGANGAAATSGEKVVKVRPTLVLPGHTGQISRAIFSNDASDSGPNSSSLLAHSFGLDDHSIRTWDLAAGGSQVGLKQSDKAIMAGAQLASPNLLLSGNADRTVCLWDTRETERVISLTCTGHTASVAAVAAHPTSQLLFASAGFDGYTKVWDARSPKQALFSVQRQKKQGPAPASAQNKVLCMAWNGQLIASGGEDGKLELLQSSGL